MAGVQNTRARRARLVVRVVLLFSSRAKREIWGCLWLTRGFIILEMKADNELAISLPVYFKSVKNENIC